MHIERIQLRIFHLIDGVSGEAAGLLCLHVVLDEYVVATEGVVHAVDRADPVVGPPVLEEGREQVTEYLLKP